VPDSKSDAQSSQPAQDPPAREGDDVPKPWYPRKDPVRPGPRGIGRTQHDDQDPVLQAFDEVARRVQRETDRYPRDVLLRALRFERRYYLARRSVLSRSSVVEVPTDAAIDQLNAFVAGWISSVRLSRNLKKVKRQALARRLRHFWTDSPSFTSISRPDSSGMTVRITRVDATTKQIQITGGGRGSKRR
jgi:hypothetical protein